MCRITGPPDLPSFGVIHGLENRLDRPGRMLWISTDEDEKSKAGEADWMEWEG